MSRLQVAGATVGVGGTSLQIDTSSIRISESAWSGSGGGTTTYEARPSYQVGFLGGTRRGMVSRAAYG